MTQVMDGEATPSQIAALLMALRMRGETVDELTGFATVMRERVLRVIAPPGTIDVVGTGGDGSGTFNISTAAAIVVAATGVPVAKHGNRAITSASGSTDVLDALGVTVEQTPEAAARGAPRGRLRVPLRARVPPGDAPRGTDAPRDRRPHGLQPGRPADQPGRRPAPAARGGRRHGRRGHRGRGPRAWHRPHVRRLRRAHRRTAARRQRRHLRREPGRHHAADRDGRRPAPAGPAGRADGGVARRPAGRERAPHRGPPRRCRGAAPRRRRPQRRRRARRSPAASRASVRARSWRPGPSTRARPRRCSAACAPGVPPPRPRGPGRDRRRAAAPRGRPAAGRPARGARPDRRPAPR